MCEDIFNVLGIFVKLGQMVCHTHEPGHGQGHDFAQSFQEAVFIVYGASEKSVYVLNLFLCCFDFEITCKTYSPYHAHGLCF